MDEQHPGDVGGLLGPVDPGEERAEPDRRDERQQDRGAAGAAARLVLARRLARREHDAARRQRDPGELERSGALAREQAGSTGIATPVAEIGATTLIVPIESAR